MIKKTPLVLFLASLVLLLNLTIPPLQNPDEPQHFAAVSAFAENKNPSTASHTEIIRLMDKNRWWHFLGMGRPDPLPNKIEDVAFLTGYERASDYTAYLNDILIYHFAMGKIIGPLTKGNAVWAYYSARLISVILFAGALILSYLGLKRAAFPSAVPAELPWVLSGFFFILFLPQFLISSVSVNPDSLSIFLSAIFFFSAFSLIGRESRFVTVLLLALSLIAGLIVDRENFFMLPAGLLAILFSARRKNRKKILFAALLLLAALALLFVSLQLFFPAPLAKGLNVIKSNVPHFIKSLGSVFSFDSLDKEFFLGFTDSFLLKFGWSAFSAAPAFYVAWRIIIALAFLGIILFVVKSMGSRVQNPQRSSGSESDRSIDSTALSTHLRFVGFSISSIFLQILAMLTVSTQSTLFAQGRYLFPLVLPIALLLVIGLKNFFDLFSRKADLGVRAVKIMIILQFLFLNYVIWSEIVPVFHIILQSPHPGS